MVAVNGTQAAATGLLSQIGSGSLVSLLVTILVAITMSLLVVDKFVSAPVDPREPPVLKGSIPILGHFLSIYTQYPFVYDKLAKQAKSPICTLPVLNKKIYLINTAAIVQSAMRNKQLEFGARSEDIARGLGLDEAVTKQITAPGKLDQISQTTIAALSGNNLLQLNLSALSHIAEEFNAVEPASPLRLDDFFGWTRTLIGTATTRALYGDHSPFSDPELVNCIWRYEAGVGQLSYGLLSKLVAGDAMEARKTYVKALVSYYTRKLDQDPSVSAVIRGRADFWRGLGMNDVLLGAVDSLPFASTINTAPTMYWLIANVFAQPKILAHLRDELANNKTDVLSLAQSEEENGSHRIGTVNITLLQKSCPYLVACYRETLRFYNTVTGSRTSTAKDTTITDHETGREYLLKKGVEVQWSAYVRHHERDVWGEQDPYTYVPERWLEKPLETNKNRRESFIPFGGGKHLCPGRNFAFAELLGCLTVLALGFEIEGVTVPESFMKFEHAGLRYPVAGPRPATVRRRTGWEDVEWRFK